MHQDFLEPKIASGDMWYTCGCVFQTFEASGSPIFFCRQTSCEICGAGGGGGHGRLHCDRMQSTAEPRQFRKPFTAEAFPEVLHHVCWPVLLTGATERFSPVTGSQGMCVCARMYMATIAKLTAGAPGALDGPRSSSQDVRI